eukprot:8664065-Prorocentrum_lima.AAC.1
MACIVEKVVVPSTYIKQQFAKLAAASKNPSSLPGLSARYTVDSFAAITSATTAVGQCRKAGRTGRPAWMSR